MCFVIFMHQWSYVCGHVILWIVEAGDICSLSKWCGVLHFLLQYCFDAVLAQEHAWRW
jgi:hypothetical protein